MACRNRNESRHSAQVCIEMVGADTSKYRPRQGHLEYIHIATQIM